MKIDRRRLLTTAACAALTGTASPARSLETESSASVRCHPLTRSLLDRAGRAKLAQIGWLETSWVAAAANAIFEIEFALQVGEAEDCRLIDHQLRVFEAHEAGLLATWETSAEIICVPRGFAV